MSTPIHIAILYSEAKREYFATEQHFISEAEVYERSKSIGQTLTQMGYKVSLIPGNSEAMHQLKKLKPDMAINLVDSVYGQEHLSATIPAMLELMQIPYTGSGMLGQAINTNKFLTKKILEQYGITTPKYQQLNDHSDDVDAVLDFPLISKLNAIHGSIEIDDSAICHDQKQLEQRARYLFDLYDQPVLLEEYVAGEEVSVIIFEGKVTKVYAGKKLIKKASDEQFYIVSFQDNWEFEGNISYEKYQLPDMVKSALKTAFDILKLEDYAKFDLRVDAAGRHYIIDVNSNPALGPAGECAIGSITKLYGIEFKDLLQRLIQKTLSS